MDGDNAGEVHGQTEKEGETWAHVQMEYGWVDSWRENYFIKWENWQMMSGDENIFLKLVCECAHAQVPQKYCNTTYKSDMAERPTILKPTSQTYSRCKMHEKPLSSVG